MGNVYYNLVGIALLIFDYGIYELVIYDIDPRREEKSELRRNLLNIDSLDILKPKLMKVIVVASIVTALNLMVSLELNSMSNHLQIFGGVLMIASDAVLSLSGCRTKPTKTSLSIKTSRVETSTFSPVIEAISPLESTSNVAMKSQIV